MVLPSLLIIIGGAFLLKNLGYISGSTWGVIWPVFLIVFGIGILLRKGKDDFFWKECCGWRRKDEPSEEEIKERAKK